MTEAIGEQEALVGEVIPPQITQRFFLTLDGLADYIKTFGITQGGFALTDVPGVGQRYLLEYIRVQP
ncbi:hypothetical protein D3C87_1334140 [compost metagenome]